MGRKAKNATKAKNKAKSQPKTKIVKKQSTQSSKSRCKKQVKKDTKQEKKQIPIDYSIQTIEQDGKQKIKIKLHSEYTIDQNHELYKNIKNLYQLYVQKQKLKDFKLYDLSQFSYYSSFEFKLNNSKAEQEKCSICQFQFQEAKDYQQQLKNKNDQDIVALKCSHKMHFHCLKMLLGDKQWLKCPVCSTIYGHMIGDQPQGNMTVYTNKLMHCDGYEDVGTIVIQYSMKAGKRGDINYPPTHRSAYLPDNTQGNQVLKLLQIAFDRKLIFTIGRSVTTGRDNQIVWNGVHHKTNTSGGAAYFGYPDPTYFDRVKLQLAAKGVH